MFTSPFISAFAPVGDQPRSGCARAIIGGAISVFAGRWLRETYSPSRS